jgi:hypothetical protein
MLHRRRDNGFEISVAFGRKMVSTEETFTVGLACRDHKDSSDGFTLPMCSTPHVDAMLAIDSTIGITPTLTTTANNLSPHQLSQHKPQHRGLPTPRGRSRHTTFPASASPRPRLRPRGARPRPTHGREPTPAFARSLFGHRAFCRLWCPFAAVILGRARDCVHERIRNIVRSRRQGEGGGRRSHGPRFRPIF